MYLLFSKKVRVHRMHSFVLIIYLLFFYNYTNTWELKTHTTPLPRPDLFIFWNILRYPNFIQLE